MSWEALIGLIMLLVLLGAIFIGVPISFTLLFLAFLFGYIGLGHTVFDLAYFQTIGMMKEELLAAVPLFIFMGFITEQAGLMERLFTAFRMLLAPVRGALFLVVVLTATVFAMATGIVGAAVTVLGIMASPIMIKSGYDAEALGWRDHGGRHARHPDPAVGHADRDGPGARRLGRRPLCRGVRPGLPARRHLHRLSDGPRLINPKLGPPVPKEERVHSLAVMLREVVIGVVPLLGLIAATLGSILAGLATPTEAAGIGASARVLLALAYRRLTPRRPAARAQLDHVDVEHGAAAGGHLQHLRRRVRPARHGQLDHQHAAVVPAAARC